MAHEVPSKLKGKGEIKQVIVIRKDLDMGKGKIASQAAHASLMSYSLVKDKYPDIAEEWFSGGQTKVVLKVDSLKDFENIVGKLRASKLPFKVVRDCGRTQVEPDTETAVGIGPYYSKDIDRVTGKLKLL
ncbi:MAG: peptidyl-tRNA hydrolase Pth2 [Candidatus Parvarchaeota archaeon]|nr:peptidyl-tRNA hydrolase Pth2 [Candidatus Parvarchaeota archaeon]